MGGFFPKEEVGLIGLDWIWLPVKCSGQDQVVVHGEFVEAVVEVPLVDETSGFVDYDE